MNTPVKPQNNEAKGSSRIVAFMTVAMKSTKLVKAIKLVKIIKPLITAVTMIGSVLVYSLSLGLPMAVGLVGMLFIHELGHVVALKQRGLRASAPVFIPMLGAVIFAPDMGKRDDEAYMGIAGPVVGGLAASLLLVAVIVIKGEPEVFSVIAFVALLLNLFNLIPIRPLDGGRVTQAVGHQFKYIGIALLAILTIFLATPGMLLIWILVMSDIPLGKLRAPLSVTLTLAMIVMIVFKVGTAQPMLINVVDIALAMVFTLMAIAFRNKEYVEHDTRPELHKRQKLLWFGRYVALAIFLAVMMVVNSAYLPAEVL